jgi:pimeloyl-ACP methyl ester carboxylesterase
LRNELPGQRRELNFSGGRLSYYAGTPDRAAPDPPLVLVHSVNAAAGAHEVRPLFEHFSSRRPTYALDLPGFGASQRRPQRYSARLMTDALQSLVDHLRAAEHVDRVDALAVSLSCEFLARAASERPDAYRTLGLVSPTGFGRGAPFDAQPESNRGVALAWNILRFPPVGWPLFRLLTSKVSIRYFLRKTWGSKDIDETMFESAWRAARAANARFAPLSFLSGFLFSADITRVYESLELPVWLAHGIRGDFTDYRWKQQIMQRANWHTTAFETGALPYFETPADFVEHYEAFLRE